jgi:hypothetical protein
MMTMEQVSKENSRAPEEIALLEARQESLLALIGELIQRNEELRLKLARFEAESAPAAQLSV